MDTLQNMRVFVRVVEAGSFTAAAQSLNTTTGAMSRAVSELEAHLRTRLLNRSTRRLALTTAGETYLKRCQQILADIDNAEEEASGAHERPSGVLRMHSFASIGQHYVLPAISRYRAQYPEVAVELTLSQQLPDLFEGSADVAVVGASTLPNSDLVSLLLGTTFSILCASPAYIHAHDAPKTPADLLHHDCLLLKTPAFPTSEWTLDGPNGSEVLNVNGPVQVNIAESLIVAIREGIGIGILPLYAAIDGLRTGSLVRVLPEYTLQKMNVYALYPSRKFIDAKTRTWVEFLRTHLPQVIARDVALLEEVGRQNVAADDVLRTSEGSVATRRVKS
ncbi:MULTISPECIES: LysR family transcriptional regulator [Paraburkholderia]|jgi:DNA-binding transcriptional LysR family regulator|uniref:LysR family transcriptional regulator n=1 Tax=Paraburkholderia caribensis TaxID=75105 RepID=A0A9Q6WPB3_9BURK|nr:MULTISPECIES: LysR family transcriptional regulator [Paraburkholderia]ALP64595.1 LysR family transcriptional regulator [Paraburkholderia caribensis]AMV45112.1 LysR family transcriptional regulator [Paraburkholderia caribensis]AUT54256.1 LysR family transcriptional regulator [Paraburkholderia caribensis]MCO4882186.1 LysR family transcriptional regulator [Paraburkholderia caribensis]MDR6384262.1 DNA-binding transcriptional LysR family regulator [Paraburkholderia caribensis]